jgi:hypothetical protein
MVCVYAKETQKIQVNENGLRGRSGERGLRAFANSSSLSLLGMWVSALPMAANPVGPLFCWASCISSGGKRATGLSDSGAEGLLVNIGVEVGLVTGVGMEWMFLRKELNEETATSGDWGDRRWAVSGGEPGYIVSLNRAQ